MSKPAQRSFGKKSFKKNPGKVVKKSKTTPKKRFNAYLLLLINTICWGAALVVTKPALSVTTPFRFLFFRYLFASIFSLPFIISYFKSASFNRKNLLTILGVELIGTTFALALLYSGLNLTTAIEASLISTTTPIFIVLGGILFLREKQEKNESLGLGLAFLATLALSLIPVWLEPNIAKPISIEGNLLIVAQNVVTAAYFLLSKRYYSGIPKFFAATMSFLVGVVSFFLISVTQSGSLMAFFNDIRSDFSHPVVIVATLFMAIFGSIIGYTSYIKAQEDVEASEATVFWYLQPLIFIPLGVVLLAESITVVQILCLVVVILGVIIAGYKKPKL